MKIRAIRTTSRIGLGARRRKSLDAYNKSLIADYNAVLARAAEAPAIQQGRRAAAMRSASAKTAPVDFPG